MSTATVFACLALFAGSAALHAASSENPENFRIEVTASMWRLNTSGNVQSSGTVIDFVHDLAFAQRQPNFFGKLVLKPGRKHRIVIEGSPLAFSGRNTIHRSITYQDQIFDVHQTLKTTASLTSLYAGYQYDVLSGSFGHLGFSAGGTYMNAGATIAAVEEGTTAGKTQSLGLPLAGTDFRIFPLRHHKWIDVDGGVRGMSFGHYGYFIEGTANGSFWLGPVALQAGYRVMEATLQQTGSDAGGITARMRGPVFSLAFKW